MKGNAAEVSALPPEPARDGGLAGPAEAVTALYEAHALGLIRLAVVILGDRVLGHWTFGSVGALSVGVLWFNASGSVLIGVIPDSGGGRVGVISGNEFTPLPTATAGEPSDSGTW
jgi:hypothetical protein